MNFWVLEIFRDFPRPPRPRKIEKNRENPEIHENPVLVTGVLRFGGVFYPDVYAATGVRTLHTNLVLTLLLDVFMNLVW